MYYFFETSMQVRSDGGIRNTLRALPGQFFPDGSHVIMSMNVRAPKEKNTYDGGTREEYPLGTRFCSDFLSLVNTNGTYYTVYDDKGNVNFHPVSIDPNFQYVDAKHRDNKMNAQYALYLMHNTNVTDASNTKTEKKMKEPKNKKGTVNGSAVSGPADKNGKANRLSTELWVERYPGQMDTEINEYNKWINRIMTKAGVRPMTRATSSEISPMMSALYSCGETIETIINRKRLDIIKDEAKITLGDFEILPQSPQAWYLQKLVTEHSLCAPCTVQKRSDDPDGAGDAIIVVNCVMAEMQGAMPESLYGTETETNLKTAIADGWTLDLLIDPERMRDSRSLKEYAESLVNGTIKLPKEASGKQSFIEQILADKKNAKPDDKAGFHIEDNDWAILLRNMKRHVNTMIVGPTGTGKTMVVRKLCEATGTPLTVVQMGSITDPTEQLVGKMDLDPSTGGTKYDWADFALAIQRPGVILLDEINRIPKNGENILFSCLDGSREINASGAKSTDKRIIKVNPECVFFATANIGADYTGTKPIDKAIRNRFFTVEMDYLDIKTEKEILCNSTGIDEDDAENIAFVANKIRLSAAKDEIHAAVSTRETVMCAELVADGFTAEEAMNICFLPIFDKGMGNGDTDSERYSVKTIISARFNNTKA